MIFQEWLSIGPRGCGRTTALVEAAKKIGATFVCFNAQHAQQMKREHDIPTIPVDANPRGTRGPYIFDHNAMLEIAHQYERRIAELQSKLGACESQRELDASMERKNLEDTAAKLIAERDQAKYGEQDMENQRDEALRRLGAALDALRWYATAEPIELHKNDEIDEYQRRAKAALEGSAVEIQKPIEDRCAHLSDEEVRQAIQSLRAIVNGQDGSVEKMAQVKGLVEGLK